MANQNQQQPKFTIRRLTPEEAEESRRESKARTKRPVPGAEAKVQEKAATKARAQKSVKPTDALTAGRFRSAGAVLAFLGSALGSGLSNEAVVRRTPEKVWWAEVPVHHERIAPLVWTSGGRPYIRHKKHWAALSLSGEIHDDVNVREETFDAQSLPVVDLAELLSETAMKPGHYHGAPEVDVIVPGALNCWVLRRALALGLETTIFPALRTPLQSVSKEQNSVLLMRLSANEKVRDHVPAALVHSLTHLPYVIVAEPLIEKNILIDVRCRIPLSPNLLSIMVPEKEIWALGLPDTGSWRLSLTGEPVDGAALLESPDIPIIDISTPSLANGPAPIAVRLVHRPGMDQQVDAVLLDDTELGWLRSFLMRRSPEEMFFLLPGAGKHLLTTPGGLPRGGVRGSLWDSTGTCGPGRFIS